MPRILVFQTLDDRIHFGSGLGPCVTYESFLEYEGISRPEAQCPVLDPRKRHRVFRSQSDRRNDPSDVPCLFRSRRAPPPSGPSWIGDRRSTGDPYSEGGPDGPLPSKRTSTLSPHRSLSGGTDRVGDGSGLVGTQIDGTDNSKNMTLREFEDKFPSPNSEGFLKF